MALKRSLTIERYSDICKEDTTLRPYQQKAKKEIFESWDEVDNVMFQMPTGTGKTRLFTSIIRDINQYSLSKKEAVKILIIAHRTELIDQIDESLKRYHVAHNVIGGSRKKREEDDLVRVSSVKEIANAKKLNEKKFPVHVASIQTIMHKRNLDDAQKLNFQFIIIDEAHHALADTYMRLWKLYPGSKKLGVTATPWRMNHQSFTDLFDKLVMSMPIKDFIKQGYLSPYVYYSLRDESYIQKAIDGIELNDFGEYDEESMEENMDIGKIRAQLLRSYQSLAKGKKGIIYAINKKHAKNICGEYEDAGYRVVAIDSETPDADRKEMVKSFKKGEIDIIVNVDIFSEGFDCPDIEFIQLARPTRSLMKYLQQVGRGLRITENKTECIILDNVGMYSRFGLPDARRHWNYHFLGHDVEDEEVPRRGSSKGTGKTRYVDLSEGTEDMELIQDVSESVDINEPQQNNSGLLSSVSDDFFPLFGITLGKTTWQDARDMGLKVRRFEKEDSRTINVEDVDFWDHDGVGIFTSLYWTNDESDFPHSWKSKGFDWNLSYDKWLDVFKKLGYDIKIIRQPIQKKYSGRTTLSAEFNALSPDGTLLFLLDFGYGENGYYTTSPKTLYSINVDFKGLPNDDNSNAKIIDEPHEEEVFDPIPTLKECNYEEQGFVFWTEDNEHIYEAYIQDDTYFIVSELIIDESQHRVHRKRVGKIRKESWMFLQLERELVSNLKTINHYVANYTVFHYEIVQSDGTMQNRYFDYKGREVDDPSVVEAKYLSDEELNQLHDYIDANISKATFKVELLGRTGKISVSRIVKENSKHIALFSLASDFGRMYYNLHQRFQFRKKKSISKEAYEWLNDFESNTCHIISTNAKSFTVKCFEDGKNYLYRYDFNGNQIAAERIASSVDDITTSLQDSDIEKLWHAFDKKATTYKFFWFLSIIRIYKHIGNNSISYKDILVGMVSRAWAYVYKIDCEFPQIDQLPSLLKTISSKAYLGRYSTRRMVEETVLEYYDEWGWDSLLMPLLKNVPYRFLSPWIPFTDNDDVVSKSNNPDTRCLYSLHGDYIKINPLWGEYLIDNYDKITQFVEKELRKYLKCK